MSIFLLGPNLGPTLGPVLGGVITGQASWRWTFGVLGKFGPVCQRLNGQASQGSY